jgi:tRNA threonylcarbamoyladenosine biosynthesis protein TsaB
VPTRTLALETSGLAGSVAACEGGLLVAEHELPADQRSAQSLAPALRRLLAEVGWQPGDVQQLAVTVGPGSFTGLRVGVTTAKTFAYAVGAELIGVDTLEVIAAQAPLEVLRVAVALDAQRQEVFAAVYGPESSQGRSVLEPDQIVGVQSWLESFDEGCWASGPVLEKLSGRLPPGVRTVDRASWHPRAATVGRLAWAALERGQRDDVWQLVPKYLRRSAAEEKWEQRGRGATPDNTAESTEHGK